MTHPHLYDYREEQRWNKHLANMMIFLCVLRQHAEQNVRNLRQPDSSKKLLRRAIGPRCCLGQELERIHKIIMTHPIRFQFLLMFVSLFLLTQMAKKT